MYFIFQFGQQNESNISKRRTCVGLRALGPWISKGKITASSDSVDEDSHLLYIGGEVRLKPSTNQTEYQLLSRREL